MKKITFWSVLILLSLAASVNAQTLISDFETDGTVMSFSAWGGVSFAIEDNPSKVAPNTSDKSGVFSHANNTWSGAYTIDEDKTAIDLSATPYITMKVYAAHPVFVMLKLEGGSDGAENLEIGYQLDATQTGKWVDVQFSFFGSAATYDKLVFFFDPLNEYAAAGEKYYFDDIVATSTATVDPQNSVTIEDGSTEVSIAPILELYSNLTLQKADGTAVTNENVKDVLTLKQGDADVPFGAEVRVNAGKHIIVFKDFVLENGKSYTYGLIDNASKFAEYGTLLTDNTSTFTTKAAPVLVDLCNFDDVEAKGFYLEENDGTVPNMYEVMSDTLGNATNILNFYKGNHGWGRVVVELAGPIDLSKEAIVSMKVYSNETQNVRLFLLTPENSEGMGIAKEVQISASGEWTTMTFDFSDLYDSTNVNHHRFTRLQFVANPGGWDAPNTYLIDDIMGGGFVPATSMLSPMNQSVDVPITQSMEISSNYSLKLNDGSSWADMDDWASLITLYQGADANGTSIPFEATVSDDSTMISIVAADGMSPGLTYYFTLKESKVTYLDAANTAVPTMGASFVTLDGPYSEIYTDFDVNDGLTFASWAEAGWAKVSNPASDDVNSSANVGAFIYGAAADQGIESGSGEVATVLGKTFINFALTPYFNMKVYSETAGRVMFKIQNDPDYGNNIEESYTLTEDETGKWVDVNFSFSGVTKTNMNRIVLFFDRDGGSMAKGDTAFFDSIYATNVPPPAAITYAPNATDAADLYANCIITSNIPLLNADGSKLESEDLADIVALKKGTFADGTAVDFKAQISADKKTITIIPNALLEVSSAYAFGVANGKLVYDNFDKEAVVDVNSLFTTTDATFAIPQTYIDFDGISECLAVESLGDGGNKLDTVADPINAANQVLKFEKGTTWSGWERVHLHLNSNIDVSTDDYMFSMRIYAPENGFVRFKVSDIKDDGGNATEVDADIEVADAWQTLYFKFADDKELGFNPYSHLLIFPDGGVGVAKTYYIDDVKGIALVGGGSNIKEVASDKLLTIYPNPTQDMVYINGVSDGEIVKVYTLSGQLTKLTPLAGGAISIADLNDGMYLIVAQDKVNKVVKN